MQDRPNVDIYSARHLVSCAAPPNAGRVARVRDVLLLETIELKEDAIADDEWELHPPVGFETDPFPLGHDIFIGDLPWSLTELIRNACTPRGHYYFGVEQQGIRHALWWEPSTIRALDDRGVPYFAWGEEHPLLRVLALSRWVRDHAGGTDIAARVIEYEPGGIQVIPQLLAESSHAYRLPAVERDWFDLADAARLRDILAVHHRYRHTLPDRIARAMWLAEYAAWCRWVDQAIPLITAAFESLVNPRAASLGKRFGARLAALAELHGIDGVHNALAVRLYRARSESVHGNHVTMTSNWSEQGVADVRLAQHLLRTTLTSAITRPAFAAIFTDATRTERFLDDPDRPSLDDLGPSDVPVAIRPAARAGADTTA